MSFFSYQLIKLRKFSSYAVVILGLVLVTGCESVEDRIQAYYESGLKLVEEGKPVKASLEFRNALKLDNEFVPALYSLANVEFDRGKILKAVGFYRKVVEIDPEHVGANTKLSRIYLLAGQFKKAQKYADKAYAKEPDNIKVLISKAAIALKLNKASDAVRYSDLILKKDPGNVEALVIRAAERMAANDPKGALVFLNKETSEGKGNISLQVFKLKALEALKDKEGIEQVLVKLIALNPTNSKMTYVLARWYLGNGRKMEAERVIRKFVKDNPDDVKAGLNLVRLISAQKGKSAAREELLALIKKNGKKAFEYRLALAQLTFIEKKNQQAIELMNKLIADFDGTEEGSKARLFLAGKMISLNRRDKAEALINTILKNDEKNTDALTIRAALQLERNQPAAAIETLLVALDQEPRSSRVLQLLGLAYERDGKVELAEEQLVKAVAIEEFKPKSGLGLVQFLLRYGKSDHAENILTRIIEKTPDNVPALAQLAQAKLRKKDWQGADAIAKTLEKANPKNKTLADQIRVAVLAGQKRYDDSIKTLKAAQLSDPDKASLITSLFRLYLRAEKYGEAEKLVKKTLETNPDNIQAYIRLGVLYSLEKRLGEAEAAYKKVIEKNPKLILGYYSLANFYLKSNRLKQAEQTSKEGLKLQKKNNALRLLLATIFEKSGQIDAAINEYESLFKDEPRSTIVANNLASLLSDRRASDKDLERAYEIAKGRFRNSKVPQFLDTLGWIHNLRGEYGKAVALLRSAVEGLPNIGIVHYHLGMAYKGLGRKELAIASLQKANALMKNSDTPERQEVRKALEQLASVSSDENKKNTAQ